MRTMLVALMVSATACAGDDTPTDAEMRERVTCGDDWGLLSGVENACEAPCQETILGGPRCTTVEPAPNTNPNDQGRYTCYAAHEWRGLQGCCWGTTDASGSYVRFYQCR